MEPDAKYTLVGASVLVLLGLVAAAVVWLVASGHRKEVQTYRIYFARQSLEGLQVRSDVRMKGIRVGAVTGFSFSTKRPGTVEMSVGVDPSTPVRESTRAVVDRNLVTGLASIRLLNADETSPMLSVAEGEDVAVIAEGESQLEQITDIVGELAERANETMRRVNSTLSDANIKSISDTLEQLRALSKNANGVLARFDTTLATIDTTAQDVRVLAGSLGGDVHRLANRYDTLGEQAGNNLREITANLGQMRGDIAQISSRADLLLNDSDLELALTSQQLRSSADAIGTTARKFGNPRSALFGPSAASLGPGEAVR